MPSSSTSEPKRRHHRDLAARAESRILKEQKSERPATRRKPIERVIRRIGAEMREGLRIEGNAIPVIQSSIESFVIHILDQAKRISDAKHHVSTMGSDIDLVIVINESLPAAIRQTLLSAMSKRAIMNKRASSKTLPSPATKTITKTKTKTKTKAKQPESDTTTLAPTESTMA